MCAANSLWRHRKHYEVLHSNLRKVILVRDGEDGAGSVAFVPAVNIRRADAANG